MSAVGASGGSRRPGGIPFLDDSTDEESGIYTIKNFMKFRFSTMAWHTKKMGHTEL